MDENHQDKTDSKLIATEDVRWVVNRKSKLLVPKHKKRTGFEGKTLWDWTQLLIIPLVLAVGGFLFTAYQHDADQQRALDQQQATILQTYIDNIQDLLLNYDLQGLGVKSQSDSVRHEEVVELARARTLTALRGLDPRRKGRLVQFIYDAKLIGFYDSSSSLRKPHPSIIGLSNADLAGADLAPTLALSNAGGVVLRKGGHDFHVYPVILEGADLEFVDLTNADLTSADLLGANLSGATLSGATLSGAYLWIADLLGANLSGATLSGATLTEATLSGADLSGANLSGANLTGANLTGANLTGATLTQRQLDQVHFCDGATLPDGLTCHRTILSQQNKPISTVAGK